MALSAVGYTNTRPGVCSERVYGSEQGSEQVMRYRTSRTTSGFPPLTLRDQLTSYFFAIRKLYVARFAD